MLVCVYVYIYIYTLVYIYIYIYLMGCKESNPIVHEMMKFRLEDTQRFRTARFTKEEAKEEART